jgi:FAD/FMN-containing dehydrogenase
VPPERIAEGARDLQALLGEHGFLPGVAGHASAGNLHFMLTPDFAKQEDLERYEAFMAKLVELIVASTTARSRPSTAPGSTWRHTSNASGARRRPS